ncbi:MAG: SPFH domain-containing protein, partial [Burkholderiales bacterium]
MKNLGGFVIIGVLALIVASMSLFTVDEREYAIVFQLGEVIDVKKGPGLYFKVPLVQNVRYFDSRIQTL